MSFWDQIDNLTSRGGVSKMATPTKKSPEVERVLSDILGTISGASSSRTTAILEDVCAICGGSAEFFRDALSEKEYTISGLCQRCQDDMFNSS